MRIADFMQDTIALLNAYRAAVGVQAGFVELIDCFIAIENQSSSDTLHYLFLAQENEEVSEQAFYPFVQFLETRWNFIKSFYPMHYTVSYNHPFTKILESLATNLSLISFNGVYWHRYSILMPTVDFYNSSLGMDLIGAETEVTENAWRASYLEEGVDITALQNALLPNGLRNRRRFVSLEAIRDVALEQLSEEQLSNVEIRANAKMRRDITQLRDFILDENERVIHIYDCLYAACQDNLLKHTNLFSEHGKSLLLTHRQKGRVMLHSVEASQFHQASLELNEAKENSRSVGGMLNRLIFWLREAGERGRRDGTAASAGADAYTAIQDFYVYVEGLSDENHDALMRANSQLGPTRSFQYVWFQLLIASVGRIELGLDHDNISLMKRYLLFCQGDLDGYEEEEQIAIIIDENIDLVEDAVVTDLILEENPEAINQADLVEVGLTLPFGSICVEVCSDQIQTILNDNFNLYNIFPENFDITYEEDLFQKLAEYNRAHDRLRSGLVDNNLNHFLPDIIAQIGSYPEYLFGSIEFKLFFYELMSANSFEKVVLQIPATFYCYLFNYVLDDEVVTERLTYGSQLQYILQGMNFYPQPMRDEYQQVILQALSGFHLQRLIPDNNTLISFSYILSPPMYMKLLNEFLGHHYICGSILNNCPSILQFAAGMPIYYQPVVNPFISVFFANSNQRQAAVAEGQQDNKRYTYR